MDVLLPTSKILNHGGESLYSTTLGFQFFFERFVLAMQFTVMLFKRLVTCASLVNIITTFQSPFLIDGSIPIVPFSHFITRSNQRTTTEHILCG